MMKYCCIEHAYEYLSAAAEKMYNNSDEELSEDERKHKVWLIKLCQEISEMYGVTP